MTLTQSQQRFYDLLADGLPHSKTEFYPLLWDEENTNKDSAVQAQMSRLRRVLAPYGHAVVCRGKNGTATYRLVRSTGVGE